MSDTEKALMNAGIRKPTVIVDWDGTCVPSAWPERPQEWLDGARQSLRALLALGYDVKIHSVRTHSSNFSFDGPNEERDNDLAYIRQMLDDADLQAVGICLDDKPPAVFYVDDRAITYDGSWARVFAIIQAKTQDGKTNKGDITDVAQEVKQ